MKLFGLNLSTAIDYFNDPKYIHLLPPKKSYTRRFFLAHEKKIKKNITKYTPRKRKQEASSSFRIDPSPRIVEKIKVKGGTDPVFLFEKILANSDVDDNLNRIFILRNGSEKVLNFMTEQERRVVQDKSKTMGIEVSSMDEEGRKYEMHLKKWHSLQVLVLNHAWKYFCKANKLEKGDIVQGWGYYKDSKFCLVLTTRKTQAVVDVQASGNDISRSDGSDSSSIVMSS